MSRDKNVANKKKGKKALKIVCIVLVVVLILGIKGCSMVVEKLSDISVVSTTRAFRGELEESISTSGTVSSEAQVAIFADAGGVLEQVNVAAGDLVRKGDILITYDMENAALAFEQANLQWSKNELSYEAIVADSIKSREKLNEANANLKVLEQQLKDWNGHLKNLQSQLSENQRVTGNELAQQNFNLSRQSADAQKALAALDTMAPDYETKYQQLQERISALSEEMSRNQYTQQMAGSSDYVAEMQKEIARIQEEIVGFETYKAKMEGQKAANEDRIMDANDEAQYQADNRLAEIGFQTAKAAFEAAKKGVVAEFDGIVMECSAVPGATVAEGMQLLTLADSNCVKVSFNASKHDIARLEEGQSAKVNISGMIYDGVVSKINRMATVSASSTPMVGVEVHIVNPDDRIIMGMDAKLEIATDKVENALLIPVEAINADKTGDFLYVVENGIVTRKSIVCGISTDIYTEVLEGITEEDVIVLSSLTGFEEGKAVTVMPEMGMTPQAE